MRECIFNLGNQFTADDDEHFYGKERKQKEINIKEKKGNKKSFIRD